MRDAPAGKGRVWQHTVYAGVFDIGRYVEVLQGVFRDFEDPSFDDRPPGGHGALLPFTDNQDGCLIKDSGVLSSCACALSRTLEPGPRNPAWLNGFEMSATAWLDKLLQLGDGKLPMADRVSSITRSIELVSAPGWWSGGRAYVMIGRMQEPRRVCPSRTRDRRRVHAPPENASEPSRAVRAQHGQSGACHSTIMDNAPAFPGTSIRPACGATPAERRLIQAEIKILRDRRISRRRAADAWRGRTRTVPVYVMILTSVLFACVLPWAYQPVAPWFWSTTFADVAATYVLGLAISWATRRWMSWYMDDAIFTVVSVLVALIAVLLVEKYHAQHPAGTSEAWTMARGRLVADVVEAGVDFGFIFYMVCWLRQMYLVVDTTPPRGSRLSGGLIALRLELARVRSAYGSADELERKVADESGAPTVNLERRLRYIGRLYQREWLRRHRNRRKCQLEAGLLKKYAYLQAAKVRAAEPSALLAIAERLDADVSQWIVDLLAKREWRTLDLARSKANLRWQHRLSRSFEWVPRAARTVTTTAAVYVGIPVIVAGTVAVALHLHTGLADLSHLMGPGR